MIEFMIEFMVEFIIEFTSGQTAQQAHHALKSSLRTRDAAQQCAVLWFQDILERKLYRQLGYGTINQYAQHELGFSKSRTGEFLQLCRTFEKLPKVRQKVASGELAYTSARVLARVANEENQDGWLDFAVNNSRRELEQEVKLARQEASEKKTGQPTLLPPPARRRPAAVVPERVTLEMSPVQLARYEKLWEQVRKQGGVPSDQIEALLLMMEAFVAGGMVEAEPRRVAEDDTAAEIAGAVAASGGVAGAVAATGGTAGAEVVVRGEAGAEATVCGQVGAAAVVGGVSSPATTNQPTPPRSARADLSPAVRPPVQIHIHQCPDCKKATVQTSRRELEIGRHELERARCDCQIDRPGERLASAVPPRIRRQVLARARHRCQRPGCDNTRFLEVHHIVPRSRDGSHDASNLEVLCSACHRQVHEGGLHGSVAGAAAV